MCRTAPNLRTLPVDAHWYNAADPLTWQAGSVTLLMLKRAKARNVSINWLLVSTPILFGAVEQIGGANPYRTRHAEDSTICLGMRR